MTDHQSKLFSHTKIICTKSPSIGNLQSQYSRVALPTKIINKSPNSPPISVNTKYIYIIYTTQVSFFFLFSPQNPLGKKNEDYRANNLGPPFTF